MTIQKIEDMLRVCAMDFKGRWNEIEKRRLHGRELLRTIMSTMKFYKAITSQHRLIIENVEKKKYDEQRFIEAERKSEKTLAIPLFN